ncbi:MAG TPA: hypothetical protein VFT71_04290 [Candidatus Nitrosocosmicus sp.]|nr:hypothetical protein [Candidatus Nitrosocosmicus sp.]
MGDSITCYNGFDFPSPHIVTFIRDLDDIEKIGLPFYVSNNIQKFTSALQFRYTLLKEGKGTGNRFQIFMMLMQGRH